MSNWERWGKRIVKSAIWAFFYLMFAGLLGVQPTWQVTMLVISCVLIGDIFDALLPTTETDRKPTQ